MHLSQTCRQFRNNKQQFDIMHRILRCRRRQHSGLAEAHFKGPKYILDAIYSQAEKLKEANVTHVQTFTQNSFH